MSFKRADTISIEEARMPVPVGTGGGYQVGSGDNEEGGCSKCLSSLLTIVSIILVIITLPISIFMVVKQVQVSMRL